MAIYLGLDSSTQGLKAILIDPELGKIVAEAHVSYTKDLAQFNCPDGVLDNEDPLVKHADPLMWVAALDMVFDRLQKSNAPLDQVAGISGSGQQHGSVYLNRTFAAVLEGLKKDQTLDAQLASTLSRKTSPIWMDSSTSNECEEITEAIGSRLQTDTGSPAIERFTGPQIRKFYKADPAAYENTDVVHLVSSFLASVLCGKSVAIDHGDGAGMNLLNLKSMQWDAEICEATAPGLLSKLPAVQPSCTVDGSLHSYFEKYGLKAGIPVVIWSGDNPNSLIGMGAAKPGTAVISLGTSDTCFAAMDRFTVDPQGYGHVFGNPAGGLMCLICFKNGSLARERVKEDCQVDWDYFDNTAFQETGPGNNGNLMLPYFVPEITPLVLKEGVRLHGDDEFCAGKAAAAVKIRAIAESQALSIRLHSGWIGEFSTVRVTGGASKSEGFCQVLADVFQAKIEKIAVTDSAGLGAAMRAANAVGNCQWDDLFAKFAAATETVEPKTENKGTYDELFETFKAFEAEVADK